MVVFDFSYSIKYHACNSAKTVQYDSVVYDAINVTRCVVICEEETILRQLFGEAVLLKRKSMIGAQYRQINFQHTTK